jgi:hypothetical protein
MKQYLDDYDFIDIENAKYVASKEPNPMPKDVIEWIWETERDPFEAWG